MISKISFGVEIRGLEGDGEWLEYASNMKEQDARDLCLLFASYEPGHWRRKLAARMVRIEENRFPVPVES